MSNCNCTCVSVPGPTGSNGSNGSDGGDGLSCFSLIDNSGGAFLIPANGGSVTLLVIDPPGSRWMAFGDIVYLGTIANGYGFYEVTAIPDATHVTVENLKDATHYLTNVTGNGVLTFGANTRILPGGLQGPDGLVPAGAFLVANNLSEGTPATMRTNLGLGTMAVQNANAVAITGGAIAGITDLPVADGGTGASTAAGARTNLGAVPTGLITASGLTSSATDKVIGRSTIGAGAVEEIACTAAGRALLAGVDAAAQLVTLDRTKPRQGLLGLLTVNLNGAISDQNVPVTFTRAIIRQVVLEAASVNLAGSAATFGIYTGSGKTGTTIVTDPFSPVALTATTKWIDVTLAAGIATDVVVPDLVNSRLYFYLSAAHGVAATAKLWIFGQDLS